MAYIKPIETRNTGPVAAYRRLACSQIDVDANIAEFRTCGHADRDAREAGKAPPPSIANRLSPGDLNLASLHGNTTATLDGAAPALPTADGSVRFADATTC